MMVNFKKYFKEILEYLNINEDEFNEIIDKFRSMEKNNQMNAPSNEII